MNCNSNGRVDILGTNAMNCFHLYDRIPVADGDTYYPNRYDWKLAK